MNNKEQKLRELRELCEYTKALYTIDMNNGFVNFGAMANPNYNKLVPEQLRLINRFRNEGELVNFILEGHKKGAIEFDNYPEHCVIGTPEAELIPEFKAEQFKPNTSIFYKNSINGMFNMSLLDMVRKLKNLREVVFQGVCADLCVMDFVRSYARYLDEINHKAKLFVVKSAIDTFDAPGHNREEWLDIAYKVMAQAGVEVVENTRELEEREKVLGLRAA